MRLEAALRHSSGPLSWTIEMRSFSLTSWTKTKVERQAESIEDATRINQIGHTKDVQILKSRSGERLQVTVDEFIDGCAKLQGEATALETKVLHLEVWVL